MVVERPVVHPMVEPALVRIQAAGVTITPAHVVWLQHAALSIRKAPAMSTADLIDWPVSCCGVLLYPLSFGAAAWLMRLPERLRNDSRSIGFACAHVKTPDVLVRLNTSLAAITAIMRWSMRLACSRAALEASVDQVLGCNELVEIPDDPARRVPRESVEWGAAIRALCVKYPGTTPDYWAWDVSRAKAYALLQQINAELPDSKEVTDYEIESNAAFLSIVDAIIAEGKSNGLR